MERKAYNAIAEWMENPERKALLVRGCRQIGKTYIIREFLEREYGWYMEINMETDVSKRSLFKDKDLSASAIIDRLMFDARDAKRPVKGRSAIFLDEIQACP
ncbi:MAG: AAA family ATPase, partial [Candidatus Methanomethylophilaceae archaeon]|nr:AAA family ATPase [Candidatus Methanomethylophilaceae archaeon]